MSALIPQRRSANTKKVEHEEDSSGYEPTLELNNISTFIEQGPLNSSYSTSNTPASMHSENMSDAYSPPMVTAFLPDRELSKGLKELTNFIKLIPSSAASGGELTWRAYDEWKEVLSSRDFTHEEFACALIYATEMVLKAKKTAASLASSSLGIITGMPLTTVTWDEVSVEMLGRMSTMAVKSGVLQACTALHHLYAVPAKKVKPTSMATGEVDLGMEVEDSEPEREDEVNASDDRLVTEEGCASS